VGQGKSHRNRGQ